MIAEVRLNDKGALDEVVGNGVYAHLEQMDAGHWYLEIGGVQIWLTSKSRISAHYERMAPAALAKGTSEG